MLGADNTTSGLLLATYTVAALVVRPFGGYWVDRYGRKAILIGSFLVFALMFAAYAAATSVAALAVVRVVHGVAWGLVGTAAGTIVVDLVPASRRGEALGIYGLSFTVAMAIGPALGMRLGETSGFGVMFFTATALALAGFAFAAFAPYPAYVPPDPPPRMDWRNLIERTALPSALNMLIVTITYGGLLSFVAVHARQIGVAHAGVFFIVYAAGIGAARVVAGRVFDRSGPRAIIIAGHLLLVAGFPVLALAQGPAAFFASAAVLGAGMGVLMPTFSAMVNNLVARHRRGAANSTFMTMFDLGIGIGMILTGALADRLPIAGAFIVSAGLGAAALAFFVLVTARHYRRNVNT